MASEPLVTLRDIHEDDIPIIMHFEQDPEGRYMAAFAPPDNIDPSEQYARWQRIIADTNNVKKVIVVDGQVVGNMLSFELFNERTVGYWLAREFWGRGIATQALMQFVTTHELTRPLYARVAHDNQGSFRVLTKCGFEQVGEDVGFANVRGEEIKEWILRLA